MLKQLFSSKKDIKIVFQAWERIMKILWIVNVVMPELAEHLNSQTGSSGTWLIDIARRLACNEEIQLAIACVSGKRYQKVTNNYDGCC